MDFWVMGITSLILPIGIYFYLFQKKMMSETVIVLFGFALIGIAGLDLFLLQLVSSEIRLLPVRVNSVVFLSELSVARYFFPAVFGGLGLNIISHMLTAHLIKAKKRFNEESGDQ